MWITIIAGMIQAVALYTYDSANDIQKEYFLVPGEDLPEEALIKNSMGNWLISIIWFGLLLVVAHFMIDYRINPTEHFAYPIIKRFRKYEQEKSDEDE